MNARLAWPAVSLAAAGMASVAVMAIAHVDTQVILLCVMGLIGPVLTAMVAAQVSEVKSQTETVERQTNGNSAALLDMVRRQSELLAASTPPAEPPQGLGQP